MSFVVRSLLVGAVAILGCLPIVKASYTTRRSWNRIYRLSDNSDVDIAPSDEGRLRWRRKDGTSGALSRNPDGSWSSTLGWTGRPDGRRASFAECDAGEIRFDGLQGKRIALDVTQTLGFARLAHVLCCQIAAGGCSGNTWMPSHRQSIIHYAPLLEPNLSAERQQRCRHRSQR